MRACSLPSSSMIGGGSTSGRIDRICPSFTNVGPSSVKLLTALRASLRWSCSKLPRRKELATDVSQGTAMRAKRVHRDASSPGRPFQKSAMRCSLYTSGRPSCRRAEFAHDPAKAAMGGRCSLYTSGSPSCGRNASCSRRICKDAGAERATRARGRGAAQMAMVNATRNVCCDDGCALQCVHQRTARWKLEDLYRHNACLCKVDVASRSCSAHAQCRTESTAFTSNPAISSLRRET